MSVFNSYYERFRKQGLTIAPKQPDCVAPAAKSGTRHLVCIWSAGGEAPGQTESVSVQTQQAKNMWDTRSRLDTAV